MTETGPIQPVRKSIRVKASQARAFEVFTAGLDRWWPRKASVGAAPMRSMTLETRLGGRWLETGTDGSEAVVGKILTWEPPRRFVVSWDINCHWKPEQGIGSEVEVRFTPEGPQVTLVELEHRHFERMGTPAGESLRKNVEGGWPGMLSLFGAEAEKPQGQTGPELIVHAIPGSPFARAVLATLEEKGAAYRVRGLAPGTLRSEPHISRHPFGRVPVLEHGDFTLYETQAILRYLDRVMPFPALTPPDPRAAARMDQVMNVSDWYFFQGVANVIAFQRIVGPKLMGLDADEAAIAAAMPKAHAVMGELARLLGKQPYFAGETVTLADLHIAPQLDFLAMTPEWSVLTAASPNVVDWLARMRARPSMTATTWERVAALAEAA